MIYSIFEREKRYWILNFFDIKIKIVDYVLIVIVNFYSLKKCRKILKEIVIFIDFLME